MAEPGLELSAMGAVRPPADAVLASAQRREQQGFDAVWWADHLLHWFPLSIWTPDLVPQAAAGQRSPHVWFDPAPVVAAAAAATREIRLGIGVTDVIRRHPASLAQTALTLADVQIATMARAESTSLVRREREGGDLALGAVHQE